MMMMMMMMMMMILTRENIWSETPLHAACTSGRSRDLVNYILGELALSYPRGVNWNK